MYNESDSFYYSETFDITNSIDRQHADTYDKNLPLWKRADGRFFWNQHMLLELIESQVSHVSFIIARWSGLNFVLFHGATGKLVWMFGIGIILTSLKWENSQNESFCHSD